MPETVRAGDAVIDFVLPDVNGVLHDSADARSRGLLLFVFWKRTCGTCQYAFPFLQRFYDRYTGSVFQVWGIAQENEADTRAFAAEYQATFPQLIDRELQVTEQYRLQAVPAFYLADSEGRILHHVAAFDSAEINAMARTISDRIGIPYELIVAPEDHAPAIKPG